RLVPLHLDAGDVRHQPAGGVELAGVDPRAHAEVVAAGADGHHDLFQRRVAGPLADAVDGALDLPRPLGDGRQAVGHGHAQVVVAVDAEDHLVDAADVLLQVGDGRGVLAGDGVADRVGDVDGGGAGLDGLLDHLGQEVQLGASGVLGRELDVL